MYQMYKDIETIRADYEAGRYTYTDNVPRMSKVAENHIFDENLSVKQNREMVAEHNRKVVEQSKHRMHEQAILDAQLTQDVVDYLVGAYYFSQDVAKKVQEYAYTERHSSMYDYFNYLDEIAYLVSDCMSLK